MKSVVTKRGIHTERRKFRFPTQRPRIRYQGPSCCEVAMLTRGLCMAVALLRSRLFYAALGFKTQVALILPLDFMQSVKVLNMKKVWKCSAASF